MSWSAAWRRASASIAGSGSIPITVSNNGASCTAKRPGPHPTSTRAPVPLSPISARITSGSWREYGGRPRR
jgi:hypothetical protein